MFSNAALNLLAKITSQGENNNKDFRDFRRLCGTSKARVDGTISEATTIQLFLKFLSQQNTLTNCSSEALVFAAESFLKLFVFFNHFDNRDPKFVPEYIATKRKQYLRFIQELIDQGFITKLLAAGKAGNCSAYIALDMIENKLSGSENPKFHHLISKTDYDNMLQAIKQAAGWMENPKENVRKWTSILPVTSRHVAAKYHLGKRLYYRRLRGNLDIAEENREKVAYGLLLSATSHQHADAFSFLSYLHMKRAWPSQSLLPYASRIANACRYTLRAALQDHAESLYVLSMLFSHPLQKQEVDKVLQPILSDEHKQAMSEARHEDAAFIELILKSTNPALVCLERAAMLGEPIGLWKWAIRLNSHADNKETVISLLQRAADLGHEEGFKQWCHLTKIQLPTTTQPSHEEAKLALVEPHQPETTSTALLEKQIAELTLSLARKDKILEEQVATNKKLAEENFKANEALAKASKQAEIITALQQEIETLTSELTKSKEQLEKQVAENNQLANNNLKRFSDPHKPSKELYLASVNERLKDQVTRLQSEIIHLQRQLFAAQYYQPNYYQPGVTFFHPMPTVVVPAVSPPTSPTPDPSDSNLKPR